MEVSQAERRVSGGPAGELGARSLYEAFVATVERQGGDVALRSGETTQTWAELAAQVGRIAGGLASLGVGRGDTVALMLSNRPEFVACDLAAVALGAVPFSIYQTSSPEQIAYVVGDAGARVAIVEAAFLDAFEQARADLPELEHLVVLDAEGGTETLERARTARPGLRRERGRRRGRPRRPADADLHLRHHRPAEGRPADPPQPADPGRLRRRPRPLPRGRRARRLLAARRPHRRARRQLLPAGGQGAGDPRLPGPARRSSSSCRRRGRPGSSPCRASGRS